MKHQHIDEEQDLDPASVALFVIFAPVALALWILLSGLETIAHSIKFVVGNVVRANRRLRDRAKKYR